jgi:hypothetical protein
MTPLKRERLMKLGMIWLSSLALACILSCTTVIPDLVDNGGASYDGDQRNSGFYGFVTNDVIVYGVITQRARDRYNNLIMEYNTKIPYLCKDYGIVDNKTNCWITLEALADFAKMNRWHKQP